MIAALYLVYRLC